MCVEYKSNMGRKIHVTVFCVPQVRRLESSPAANIPPMIQTGSRSLMEKQTQASRGQRIIRQVCTTLSQNRLMKKI